MLCAVQSTHCECPALLSATLDTRETDSGGKMIKSNDLQAETDEAEVPLYRRRWFVLCTLAFCSPATILIAITGSIYVERDGGMYPMSDDAAWYVVLIAFIVAGLIIIEASRL